ncbi:MAG: helix-turn-helix transcriptional regulator [Armatimonadetes bacterium]|nr:helix-turn-helix transcriptional regulator [Armatimonadota bacterium]
MKESAALTFAALGEPVRLELVERLVRDGPQTISDLTDGLPMTRQGARKHLEVLEGAAIVQLEKSGRTQVVSLHPEAMRAAQDWMAASARAWIRRLDALQTLVEGD